MYNSSKEVVTIKFANIEEFIKSCPDNHVFYMDEIAKSLPANSNLNSLRWDLYHLEKKGTIKKIDKNTFYKGIKTIYQCDFKSTESKQISKLVKEKFPNLSIAIWDEIALNEWFNLLLVKNTIHVEVEKDYISDVFRKIQEEFPGHVLLSPSIDEFFLYQEDNLIVVSKLFSRSPIDKRKNKTTIEKLIIDLLFDNYLKSRFDTNEVYNAISMMNENYIISKGALLRYARRKNVFSKASEILDELNITDNI